MNSDLATKIADRFSIEDIADATGISTNMFIQAFADEIMDNLSALSEIDQAFDTQGEEDC
jgi:hypothetical protein|tara:strand:+ start:6173 stop:6352 length:180 start_codon:yes stop_codon:yes gene_type:complete